MHFNIRWTFIIISFAIIFVMSCGQKEIVKYSKTTEKIIEKYYINKLTKNIEGKFYSYDSNGNLFKITEYKSNVPNGKSVMYCLDGKTVLESSLYLEGQLNGVMEGFYCNGNPKFKIIYDKNKILKVYDLFTSNGIELFPGNHKDGNGVILKYDETGNLVSRMNIKNGLKDGYSYDISNTGFVDSSFYIQGVNEDLKALG